MLDSSRPKDDPRAWPYCEVLDGDCLVAETGRFLGGDVLVRLLEFAWTAEVGSRLTLQRNPDGYSVQVTGAVHRAGSVPGLEDLRALRVDLGKEGPG